MKQLNHTGCPECHEVGSLEITIELRASPIGTYSLSGNQLKVSATETPRLSCNNCTFWRWGRYDGRCAVFEVLEEEAE